MIPGKTFTDASGIIFGPIGSPGTVPGTVTRTELGKQGGTVATPSAEITAGASAQAGAKDDDDTSLESPGTETGGTEIGAEMGAAGVGTEVDTTTVDTMGPEDIADVSDKPLLQAVRSATPTPAAPPVETGPEAAEGPRETNNKILREQHWYSCQSMHRVKQQLMERH